MNHVRDGGDAGSRQSSGLRFGFIGAGPRPVKARAWRPATSQRPNSVRAVHLAPSPRRLSFCQPLRRTRRAIAHRAVV